MYICIYVYMYIYTCINIYTYIWYTHMNHSSTRMSLRALDCKSEQGPEGNFVVQNVIALSLSRNICIYIYELHRYTRVLFTHAHTYVCHLCLSLCLSHTNVHIWIAQVHEGSVLFHTHTWMSSLSLPLSHTNVCTYMNCTGTRGFCGAEAGCRLLSAAA